MKKQNHQKSFTVPAGKYVLSDPCYAAPKDQFGKLLEKMNYEDGLNVYDNGAITVMLDTANGDGTYQDQHGRSFPVDSGTIGLTPLIENWTCLEAGIFSIDKGMYIVEFAEETVCTSNEGVLTFGEIRIDTNLWMP